MSKEKFERPINEIAKCVLCAHSPVCGKFATMVNTNGQFMDDPVFALQANPIDVNHVARHCKEFVTEQKTYTGKQIPDEDLV